MAEKIKYTRKDLKGPDEFISVMGRFVAWSKENQVALMGAVGTLAVAGLIFFGSRTYSRWQENKAAADLWPHLNRAREVLLVQGEADPEKLTGIEQYLTAHVNMHPDTRASVYARYFLGSIAFEKGNYSLAVNHFRTAIGAGEEQGIMKFLLQQGLAQALEAGGDLVNAATAYQEAAGYAEGELCNEARIGQARVLSLHGKTREAIDVYRKILTESPEGPLKAFVELRIAQLG